MEKYLYVIENEAGNEEITYMELMELLNYKYCYDCECYRLNIYSHNKAKYHLRNKYKKINQFKDLQWEYN